MSSTTGESKAMTRNSNFGLGSNSRHLKFLAPAPTSKSFWLRLKNDLVHSTPKPLNYLYNWLATKTMSVEQELKVQAPTPAPLLQMFGSGSNHPILLGIRTLLHTPGWKTISIAGNQIFWQRCLVWLKQVSILCYFFPAFKAVFLVFATGQWRLRHTGC